MDSRDKGWDMSSAECKEATECKPSPNTKAVAQDKPAAPPKGKDERLPMPFRQTFTWYMTKLIVAVWGGFQIVLMAIYLYFGRGENFSADDLINRWSWTDAQALGLAAAFVAVYAMYRQEQYMWKRFGVRMNKDNQTAEFEEAEELNLEKFVDVLKPLEKIIDAVNKEMDAKGITTDEVVQSFHKLMQYEKDIKIWMDRMEKIMPLLDTVAQAAEKIDQKELGIAIGRAVANLQAQTTEPAPPPRKGGNAGDRGHSSEPSK